MLFIIWIGLIYKAESPSPPVAKYGIIPAVGEIYESVYCALQAYITADVGLTATLIWVIIPPFIYKACCLGI